MAHAKSLPKVWFQLPAALLVLYVGSFLAFQAFPHRFSLAHHSDPKHYIVVFSVNTDVHCAARSFYLAVDPNDAGTPILS
jgi:hypothetical protein